MRTLIGSALSILLFLGVGFAQGSSPALGSVRGDVFTKGTNGEPAVLPSVRIVLHGPITKEAESDAQGAFAIDGLPPGTYEIEANALGLSGGLAVEVTAGASSTVPLEMNMTMVSNTVNVTATELFVADESAQHNTISQSVVEKAPNQEEKIDSLLPLVPGVVRGPDGRINMKGAQATQAGWLVNSANVTDPATGGQAISLPIDVVSSVQVISNPYDPEYGRFTGAVSSVETRTSNFDKFHFSIQNLAPRARDRDGSIVGIGGFTPRTTITGPLIKDRLAFTQSLEYRFVRTPVESLPALQRDTTLESFDSFSQFDLKINDRQTATLSVAIFPAKPGELGRIAAALGKAKVNISAVTCWSAGSESPVHLLVSSPAKAKKVLQELGVRVTEEEVLRVTLPDKPGALGEVGVRLGAGNINIEYAYASVPTGGKKADLILVGLGRGGSFQGVAGPVGGR